MERLKEVWCVRIDQRCYPKDNGKECYGPEEYGEYVFHCVFGICQCTKYTRYQNEREGLFHVCHHCYLRGIEYSVGKETSVFLATMLTKFAFVNNRSKSSKSLVLSVQ